MSESTVLNGATKHAPLRRITKPVTIALDRDRALVYDLNAICSFEEATGQSVVEALRNLTMTNIRALIWAGLLVDDPAITINQAGALIRFTDITAVTAALRDALSTDLSSAGASGGDMARPTPPAVIAPAGSTGESSGAPDESTSDLQTVNSGA